MDVDDEEKEIQAELYTEQQKVKRIQSEAETEIKSKTLESKFYEESAENKAKKVADAKSKSDEIIAEGEKKIEKEEKRVSKEEAAMIEAEQGHAESNEKKVEHAQEMVEDAERRISSARAEAASKAENDNEELKHTTLEAKKRVIAEKLQAEMAEGKREVAKNRALAKTTRELNGAVREASANQKAASRMASKEVLFARNAAESARRAAYRAHRGAAIQITNAKKEAEEQVEDEKNEGEKAIRTAHRDEDFARNKVKLAIVKAAMEGANVTNLKKKFDAEEAKITAERAIVAQKIEAAKNGEAYDEEKAKAQKCAEDKKAAELEEKAKSIKTAASKELGDAKACEEKCVDKAKDGADKELKCAEKAKENAEGDAKQAENAAQSESKLKDEEAKRLQDTTKEACKETSDAIADALAHSKETACELREEKKKLTEAQAAQSKAKQEEQQDKEYLAAQADSEREYQRKKLSREKAALRQDALVNQQRLSDAENAAEKKADEKAYQVKAEANAQERTAGRTEREAAQQKLDADKAFQDERDAWNHKLAESEREASEKIAKVELEQTNNFNVAKTRGEEQIQMAKERGAQEVVLAQDAANRAEARARSLEADARSDEAKASAQIRSTKLEAIELTRAASKDAAAEIVKTNKIVKEKAQALELKGESDVAAATTAAKAQAEKVVETKGSAVSAAKHDAGVREQRAKDVGAKDTESADEKATAAERKVTGLKAALVHAKDEARSEIYQARTYRRADWNAQKEAVEKAMKDDEIKARESLRTQHREVAEASERETTFTAKKIARIEERASMKKNESIAGEALADQAKVAARSELTKLVADGIEEQNKAKTIEETKIAKLADKAAKNVDQVKASTDLEIAHMKASQQKILATSGLESRKEVKRMIKLMNEAEAKTKRDMAENLTELQAETAKKEAKALAELSGANKHEKDTHNEMAHLKLSTEETIKEGHREARKAAATIINDAEVKVKQIEGQAEMEDAKIKGDTATKIKVGRADAEKSLTEMQDKAKAKTYALKQASAEKATVTKKEAREQERVYDAATKDRLAEASEDEQADLKQKAESESTMRADHQAAVQKIHETKLNAEIKVAKLEHFEHEKVKDYNRVERRADMVAKGEAVQKIRDIRAKYGAEVQESEEATKKYKRDLSNTNEELNLLRTKEEHLKRKELQIKESTDGLKKTYALQAYTAKAAHDRALRNIEFQRDHDASYSERSIRLGVDQIEREGRHQMRMLADKASQESLKLHQWEVDVNKLRQDTLAETQAIRNKDSVDLRDTREEVDEDVLKSTRSMTAEGLKIKQKAAEEIKNRKKEITQTANEIKGLNAATRKQVKDHEEAETASIKSSSGAEIASSKVTEKAVKKELFHLTDEFGKVRAMSAMNVNKVNTDKETQVFAIRKEATNAAKATDTAQAHEVAAIQDETRATVKKSRDGASEAIKKLNGETDMRVEAAEQDGHMQIESLRRQALEAVKQVRTSSSLDIQRYRDVEERQIHGALHQASEEQLKLKSATESEIRSIQKTADEKVRQYKTAISQSEDELARARAEYDRLHLAGQEAQDNARQNQYIEIKDKCADAARKAAKDVQQESNGTTLEQAKGKLGFADETLSLGS